MTMAIHCKNDGTAVGASLLAMVANDGAGCLMPRGVLQSIASELAPTGVLQAQR